MAAISVTYSFTNGTTASGTEVNTNFTNIIDGLSDGTKDLSVNAITAAGACNFNGNVTLGNASGDDITVTGSLASSLIPKTDDSVDLGSSSKRWNALYLSDGWVGTTTNNSAGTGYVGEYVSATVAFASPASLTTATATNVTSISLTAGDWDIQADIVYKGAAGVVFSEGYVVVSKTSATLPASSTFGNPTAGEFLGGQTPITAYSGGVNWFIQSGSIRASISSTTTFYLIAYAAFTTASVSVAGTIAARRMR